MEEHHEHFLMLVTLMKSDEHLNIWSVNRETQEWLGIERVRQCVAGLCEAKYIKVVNENDPSPRYTVTKSGKRHYKKLIRHIDAQMQEVKRLEKFD